MHMRRRPSFLRANSIGAPYGLALGDIRLVSRNSCICVFSSYSSSCDSGYSLRLGGGAAGSERTILCWCYDGRGIGKVGSVKTDG